MPHLRASDGRLAHTGPSDSSGSESNLEIWRTFSRLDRGRDNFRVDTVLRGAKGDWAWFL